MTVTVSIEAQDVNDLLDVYGYTRIELYSGVVPGTVTTLVTTITLVADTFQYSYEDASGTQNTYYRYRFTGAGGGAPVSAYTNPFQQQGGTRLRLRQRCLEDYGAGAVLLAASSGQLSTAIACSDYRIASTLYNVRRGVGSWMYPTSGARVGETTRVVSTVPSTVPAVFTVSPAMTGALATSDEFEWHWFVSPDDWNAAINRGLARYWILNRVSILGNGDRDISLSYLPWLTNRNQITGLWYYPSLVTGSERAWGSGGRWWGSRQEQGIVTLMTTPGIDASTTVYMEAVQQVPPVYTDDSQLPADCNIELAAALAYDEVLNQLVNPASGGSASTDKKDWEVALKKHRQGRLRTLIRLHGPHPRVQRPQLQNPVGISVPWSSR